MYGKINIMHDGWIEMLMRLLELAINIYETNIGKVSWDI